MNNLPEQIMNIIIVLVLLTFTVTLLLSFFPSLAALPTWAVFLLALLIFVAIKNNT